MCIFYLNIFLGSIFSIFIKLAIGIKICLTTYSLKLSGNRKKEYHCSFNNSNTYLLGNCTELEAGFTIFLVLLRPQALAQLGQIQVALRSSGTYSIIILCFGKLWKIISCCFTFYFCSILREHLWRETYLFIYLFNGSIDPYYNDWVTANFLFSVKSKDHVLLLFCITQSVYQLTSSFIKQGKYIYWKCICSPQPN